MTRNVERLPTRGELETKIKTTADLRKFMLDQLERQRTGEIARSEANARARTARVIVETVRLELMAVYNGKYKPLSLVDDDTE